ncbi:RNA 2',3'-cyclic phosphodiesterase [Pseudomonas sp. KSR10]|uniref:RNA 2',3'-cyclic phosphodiesterase n=1 Tax=Stutzerimonas stutzeri TaxID=316 RepID=A0A0D9AIR0_STUST|nr:MULTISPECIES: RNA 2',3'-cyclic phosphodiesterase [Pseudomonadaceae]KJH79241.1 2'-5' RNA ligase [Stutzerimonas stutzeri]MCG6540828.1 RNA 2',3'-cyclic phosphodiesterase [Pseudomonas sp. KSR10]
MSTEKPLRLFFALSCPPPLAEAICSWRDSQNLGGRPVAQANLHLTLAFLGGQPTAKLEGLKQLGDHLRADAFTLRLDQLQTIGHGFACLIPSQVPPPLSQLVEQLHAGLSTHGFALDSRPFLPHMTLSREAQAQPDGAPPTFKWQVERFGLFLSENTGNGVRYRELENWPLKAPSG